RPRPALLPSPTRRSSDLTHIAMCKIQMAKVYHDIVQRAIQLHGSLGMTLELPLADMWMGLPALALADGPTEVHKIQVAKAYLREDRKRTRLNSSHVKISY